MKRAANDNNGGGENASSNRGGKGTVDYGNESSSHGVDGDGHGGGDQEVYADADAADDADGDNAVAGDSDDLGVDGYANDGDGGKDSIVFSLVYQGCYQDGQISKDLSGGTRLFRQVKKD